MRSPAVIGDGPASLSLGTAGLAFGQPGSGAHSWRTLEDWLSSRGAALRLWNEQKVS